jgi:hypothetical protein
MMHSSTHLGKLSGSEVMRASEPRSPIRLERACLAGEELGKAIGDDAEDHQHGEHVAVNALTFGEQRCARLTACWRHRYISSRCSSCRWRPRQKERLLRARRPRRLGEERVCLRSFGKCLLVHVRIGTWKVHWRRRHGFRCDVRIEPEVNTESGSNVHRVRELSWSKHKGTPHRKCLSLLPIWILCSEQKPPDHLNAPESGHTVTLSLSSCSTLKTAVRSHSKLLVGSLAQFRGALPAHHPISNSSSRIHLYLAVFMQGRTSLLHIADAKHVVEITDTPVLDSDIKRNDIHHPRLAHRLTPGDTSVDGTTLCSGHVMRSEPHGGRHKSPWLPCTRIHHWTVMYGPKLLFLATLALFSTGAAASAIESRCLGAGAACVGAFQGCCANYICSSGAYLRSLPRFPATHMLASSHQPVCPRAVNVG